MVLTVLSIIRMKQLITQDCDNTVLNFPMYCQNDSQKGCFCSTSLPLASTRSSEITCVWSWGLSLRADQSFVYSSCWFFVAAPRTSLAGLQSTVNVFPCTAFKTEVLNSFLSLPSQMWAVANKGKLFKTRQLKECIMCRQLGCPNRTNTDKIKHPVFLLQSNCFNCLIDNTVFEIRAAIIMILEETKNTYVNFSQILLILVLISFNPV